MTNCWMLLSFSLTMVHRTPAGVTVACGFGRSASLSQKFSGGETGTGTEVEVDYQPPQGNRLEEKDRVLTHGSEPRLTIT